MNLSIQANSEEQLRKLLDLAISELDRIFKGKHHTWATEEGAVVEAKVDGTMGSFHLGYMLGTPALVECRSQLLKDGYRLQESTAFGLDDFDVYEHPETGDTKRLYHNPAKVTDHRANEDL
ncbi:hypothetical protein EGJ23_04210 [Pseudomonas sp. o96-267]|uniref:hypothetical protein n=1 Tax=Pseudomonas sp. o96-267 TaxID=2479853 RepID=UPI000F76E194|nr:hypothetical protein [Pseudomonas sp. o96-267]RRV28591.1 hypothetical protein EGJ23_04210 [Pseudomonas sp. o96-267]